MSLAGKFVFHFGRDYAQTGEIVAQVSDDLVLVRFFKCEHIPPSAALLKVSDMVGKIGKDGSIESEWELFMNRDELDAFDEWLSTPSEHEMEAGTALN